MRTRVVVTIGVIAGIVGLTLAAVGARLTYVALFADPPAITESQVVGEWRGADGATLILAPDRTYQAVGLPLQVQAPDTFDAPLTGSGSWLLTSPDRYDVQSVSLRVDTRGAPLYLHRSNDGIRLYLWVRQADDGKRYWLDRN